ncbi:hypothetical protein BD769DRAFT_1754922 [Suillus cothurnatus]|nr:hypothetical protein BD769DRAFT_1754922 [Suillus cothurnatus]
MSSSQKNTNNAVLNTSSPQHRLHDSSPVLPGSGSYAAVQTQDYSPTNIECISSCVIHGKDTSAQSDDANFTRAALEPTPSAGRTRPASERERSCHSIIAIASHWYMLVGGAAIGELSNPPEGHGARFGDMVVGKTRKYTTRALERRQARKRLSLERASSS